jgi:hypothetical protein
MRAHHFIVGPVALVLSLWACSDSGTPTDTADAGDTADSADACGGCPGDKTCCPSRWSGDSPRCVDTMLNPEHCGACGHLCDTGACHESACVASASCDASTPCAEGASCSTGAPGGGRCCPAGTSFQANPSSFFGCCPEGEQCGCLDGAMCPISLPERKVDIRILDAEEVASLGDALLATRLTTWRYEDDPARTPRLGFLIDADAPPFAVASSGENVDLYGYLSLAVATLKQQHAELTRMRRDLDALRARLDRLDSGPTR